MKRGHSEERDVEVDTDVLGQDLDESGKKKFRVQLEQQTTQLEKDLKINLDKSDEDLKRALEESEEEKIGALEEKARKAEEDLKRVPKALDEERKRALEALEEERKSDLKALEEVRKRAQEALEEVRKRAQEALEEEKKRALEERRRALEEIARKAEEEKKKAEMSVEPAIEDYVYVGDLLGSSSLPKHERAAKSVRFIVSSFSYLVYLDFTRGRWRKQGLRSVISSDEEEGRKIIEVESEAKVVTLVLAYVNDLLVAMGLKEKYKLKQEIGKFGLRPDIYVLHMKGDSHMKGDPPVGIIKINKPRFGNEMSPLDDSKILGQVYDYLMLLHAMHGVDNPIGLVSTMQEVRVCWLNEIPDIGSLGELATLIPEPGSEVDVGPILNAGTLTGEEIPRVMRVSAIVATNKTGHLANLVVGSMLPAMIKCQSRMDKDPFLESPEGKFRIFPQIFSTERYLSWTSAISAVSWKPVGLAVTPMPPENCETLCLLKYLGSGAHGYTWLASTLTGGHLCVLKFSHPLGLDYETDEDPSVSMERERKNWEVAYPHLNVKVQEWRKKVTLVMPYLAQASLNKCANIRDTVDAADEETLQAVRAELERFASLGLEHVDIKWANIGFYCGGEIDERRGKGKKKDDQNVLRAVLIDLALVREHPRPWKGAKEWVSASLDKLRNERDSLPKTTTQKTM